MVLICPTILQKNATIVPEIMETCTNDMLKGNFVEVLNS